MSIHDLAVRAAEAISNAEKFGRSVDEAAVLITTPKGWKPPPRFPRRDIVQVKEDGTRVAYVPAMKLLAWLTAHGFIKVEVRDAPAV